MAILELSLAGLAGLAGADLSPRRFTIREAVSSLFSISLLARSPDPSLDLAALLDQPATFRIVPGYIHVENLGARTWRGIVVDAEQVHALQPGLGQVGLSTYQLRIVPDLFRLTQRRGNRIFQQRSIPEIIDKLLSEWSIPSVWAIDRGRYPRLEYKIQYAESDFSFFSRLLEEAGIAFTFPEEQDGKLTFSDRLESNAPRPGFLRYVDQPNQAAEEEFITSVRLDREVRPGAFRVRDHELRNPDFALVAEAPRVSGPEGRLEQYHFDQGAFLVETGKGGGTPVADDKGIARHDLAYGQKLAERALHAERVGVRSASFESNAFDLAPGSVFSMDLHPHVDLSPNQKLLVLETTLEGTAEGEWSLSGHAVFADMPYRPPRQTPKPTVYGLQSATVVGPKGQEIHTDEFGRVRVQFPWDREGKKDEGSSCWVRVNQGWGGMGYGMVVLPRIGQEVLVGFAEGDPDLPFVLGRAYNALQQVPYRLPEHKTRSAWKSDSSVGSGGFNEIMFEDLAGKELVWEQAEKDRKRVVKNDEFVTVRHDRRELVKNDTLEQTEGARSGWVGKDAHGVTGQKKRERVDEDRHVEVRGGRSERVDGKQSLMVAEDRDEQVGGRYALKAREQVHVVAGEGLVGEATDEVTVSGPGGFLRIDASGVTIVGTVVKINAGGTPRKGKGSKPEAPEELDAPSAWGRTGGIGGTGGGEEARAPRRLPILKTPPVARAGGVLAASLGPPGDPELAVLCVHICACNNTQYKQACVTQALWAEDDAAGNMSTIKAEVPYDMSKRPPAPIMSNNNPKRATRRKPLGSRIPDVVIVNKPGDLPTQGNIRKVVEIKFPPDKLSREQDAEYRTIAGLAEFQTLSPQECNCSDPEKKHVPQPVPVPEKKRQPTKEPEPVPVPVPLPVPIPVPQPAPRPQPVPVPQPVPTPPLVPQPSTARDVAEIAVLALVATALVLDDALPTGATQADDAALPVLAARLAQLLGRLKWGF